MNRRIDIFPAQAINAAIHPNAFVDISKAARRLAGDGIPLEIAIRVLTRPTERRPIQMTFPIVVEGSVTSPRVTWCGIERRRDRVTAGRVAYAFGMRNVLGMENVLSYTRAVNIGDDVAARVLVEGNGRNIRSAKLTT